MEVSNVVCRRVKRDFRSSNDGLEQVLLSDELSAAMATLPAPAPA